MHVNSLQKGWCIYHPGSQLFCSIIFASVEVTTNDSTTFIIGKNNLTSSTPFFSQFSYSDYQDRFSSTIPNNKPFPFDYSKVYFMSSQTIIQMGVIHANREQTNWPEKLATFYCRQLSILSIKRDPDHQITNCSGARAVVTGKKLSIKLLIKCSGFWIGVMTRLFTLYTTRLTMESEIEPPVFGYVTSYLPQQKTRTIFFKIQISRISLFCTWTIEIHFTTLRAERHLT